MIIRGVFQEVFIIKFNSNKRKNITKLIHKYDLNVNKVNKYISNEEFIKSHKTILKYVKGEKMNYLNLNKKYM